MLSVQQPVVGIFRNQGQAEQAVNELRQVGFDNRHIRCAKHGISIGWVLRRIKSLLRQQDIAASGIYKDLVSMGMPAEEARYYQNEFEAGHCIVAVLRSGVPLVATSILIRNGGDITNERFALSLHSNNGTGQQEPTTEDINDELNGTNDEFAQSVDDDQSTTVEEPPSEDVNTELDATNEHNTPPPDHNQSTPIQEPLTEDVNAKLDGTNERDAPSTDHEKENDTQETNKDLINA